MAPHAPISATWLAEVSGLPVADVVVERVGLFSSEVLRLRCDTPPQAPDSLVLKRPNPANTNRLGESFESEGRFYDTLAPSLPIRTPHCYAAGPDYLILEDVLFESFSWAEGASEKHLHGAMDGLRALHEAGTAFSLTGAPDWIPSFAGDKLPAALGQRCLLGWRRHRDALTHWCPAFAASAGPVVDKATHNYRALGRQATLLQGDAHLENLPLLQHEAGVVMFDWQGPRLGHALFDVAYFLVMSLPPNRRRQLEDSILEYYLQRKPTSEDMRSYRRGVAARATGIIELAADYSVERVKQGSFGWVVERCLQAAVDHDVDRL